MPTELKARCPKCNAKVRITAKRWDVKRQTYIQQPAYGMHAPHGNSYDPGRCEMSNQPFKGELIEA